MKTFLTRVACGVSVCIASLQAEPVKLVDVSHAPLWFAHVDMSQLNEHHAKLEEGREVDEAERVAGCRGVVQHVVALRKLMKESLSIELEDIRGVTIFGATSSGKETCFLLKGKLGEVRMGGVVENYSVGSAGKPQTYTLHKGLNWLGEEWYLARLGIGEIAAANSRAALKTLLFNRHSASKKSSVVASPWQIDAATKRDMAGASAVLAFNMEGIQRELKLESSLSNLVRTACLVVRRDEAGEVSTKLTLQAKDAEAMKLVAPEIQVLLTLLRAYEEGEIERNQGDGHGACWGRAQIEVDESRLSISMQGESDEMIESLQKLEKLLPKQGE